MDGYRLKRGCKDTYVPAVLGLVSLAMVLVVTSLFDTNIKSIDTNEDVLGVVLAIIAVAGLLTSLCWSGWRAFKIEGTLNGVMVETAKTTSLVFIILLGAAMLTAAFRPFGGAEPVRDFLTGLPGGFWSQFVLVMGVLFVRGLRLVLCVCAGGGVVVCGGARGCVRPLRVDESGGTGTGVPEGGFVRHEAVRAVRREVGARVASGLYVDNAEHAVDYVLVPVRLVAPVLLDEGSPHFDVPCPCGICRPER